MGFGLVNRDSLPKFTLDEFEYLVSQLQGFLFVAHNEDGTLKAAPDVTNGVPTGTMCDYGGSSDPANWYICDGRQASRLDDQTLFNVIGTTYGAGDGSTTFNIPDYRGRIAMGKTAAGTGSTLGGSFGTLDHTHTVPALSIPALSVPSVAVSGTTGTGVTGDESAHTHSFTVPPIAVIGGGAAVAFGGSTFSIQTTNTAGLTTGAGGAHHHSVPSLSVTGTTSATVTGTDVTGAGVSGSNNPPILVSNKIIKR